MYKKNSLKNLFLFLLSISIGFQAIAMQRYAGGPGSSGDGDPIRTDSSAFYPRAEHRMRSLIFAKEEADFKGDATSIANSLDKRHKRRFVNKIKQIYGSGDQFPSVEEMKLIAARTKPSLKKEQKQVIADSFQQDEQPLVGANQNYFTPYEPVFFDQVAVENPDQVVDGIVVIINAAKKLPSFVRTVLTFDFPTEKIVGLALIAHCVKNMF